MNVLGLKSDTIDMAWAFANPKDERNPVQFLDFTVDGVGLSTKFGGGDLTSLTVSNSEFRTTNLRRLAGQHVTLPTFEPRFHRTLADRLLRRMGLRYAPWESAFADGRVGLLYCPCGDMDCGVTSTRIEFSRDTVTWHDVGRQVTYAPEDSEWQGYLNDAPTFTFARAEYAAVVDYLLAADWSEQVPDPDRR